MLAYVGILLFGLAFVGMGVNSIDRMRRSEQTEALKSQEANRSAISGAPARRTAADL